jgi:hypothetical protein
VTWGAGPAIADALRLTDAELLSGEDGAVEALPSLDAPEAVRWVCIYKVDRACLTSIVHRTDRSPHIHTQHDPGRRGSRA